MATIYAFSRWIYEDRNIYGTWAAISFIFAVLLKVPNLYLILPILFIAFVKFGWRFIRQPKLWTFLLLSFVPIGLFSYHQYLVRTAFPNPAMTNFKLEFILKYIKVYLTGKMFYKASFDNLVSYTLTPIGFTLFSFGLFIKPINKKEWLFHVWLLSVGLFFLLMPAQSIQGYYQIHLLPVACIFIAKAAMAAAELQVFRYRLLPKKVSLALFSLIILTSVFRYSYAYYRVPENFKYVVETGRAIDHLTEKDALVIASIENGPDLVYYSNRKGWPFMINREATKEEDKLTGEDKWRIYDRIEYLEYLRSKGAKYFASASMSEFLSHAEFSKYMFENYRILKQTPNFIIFDIQERAK
jgi:hypothetical protein